MIQGHGDDAYKYKDIRINYSSNIFAHFDHTPLYKHLATRLNKVENYPEPEPYNLETALAKELNINSSSVMATNGATEAIYLISQRFRKANSVILQPTFSEYADACTIHDHCITNITDTETLERLAEKADNKQQRMLFWLCNPNNPTGRALNKDWLVNMIKACQQAIFIIDESYAAYTTKPVIQPQETIHLHNVVIIGSMTKDYGVPGLRLGYATGHPELIDEIKKGRMPWSVNQIAIEAALYLIRHNNSYIINADYLCKERQRVAMELERIGIVTEPSDSNMLLCKIGHGSATELKNWLATEHGLLIRDASNFYSLSKCHFRIAVQQPKENDLLINALKEWTTL